MLRSTFLGTAALALLTSGCLPATRVVKNPDPHDRGLRYYRPKPYLLVQPMTDESGVPVDGFVTLETEMLPDFSEEYSVHIRSGLGTNETSITLRDGWMLESLNVSLDSQVDENLEAVAELAGQIPTITDAGAAPGTISVRATNVPIGYYESVVSKGPDGKKRLYGFRYVGFMPYAPCPVESCGVEHQNCYAAEIYGLMFDGRAMVFRPLHEAAAPAERVSENSKDSSRSDRS